MKRYLHILLLFLAVSVVPAKAQTAADSLLSLGRDFHRTYYFDEAIDAYEDALDSLAVRDSLSARDSLLLTELESRLLLSRNGLAMTEFVDHPTVIARRRCAREDFFLWYPDPDSTWHSKPSVLDSTDATFLSPATRDTGDETLYFSAPDPSGTYRLYSSGLDSLGQRTAAEPFEAELPEGVHVVYPVSVGKDQLCFSSDGLYGVGGFDLYTLRWNPRKQGWGAPVNMGFPYSSPADDFLFVPYPGRGLSVFASNRNCPADSLDVYVIEFSNTQASAPVTDPDDLAALCRMDPPQRKVATDDPFAGRDHAALYMKRMAEVRALRDSLTASRKAADELRLELGMAPDSLRQQLQNRIIGLEKRQGEWRDEMDRLTSEVRVIEALFLEDGLVFDPDKLAVEEEPELPEFEWVRHAMVMEPEPVVPVVEPEEVVVPNVQTVAPAAEVFTAAEERLIRYSGQVMYVFVMPLDSTFLRTPSRDFSPEELASPLLDTLIRKMYNTVTDPSQDGVGIAGPQVGIGRRLVLVQRFDKPGEPIEAYANIRIDSLSGPVVCGTEGCLSIPGKRGIVPRSSVVRISYDDRETMERRTETVEGFSAIIFQHECDHLDGILYIDRAIEVFDEQ